MCHILLQVALTFMFLCWIFHVFKIYTEKILGMDDEIFVIFITLQLNPKCLTQHYYHVSVKSQNNAQNFAE